MARLYRGVSLPFRNNRKETAEPALLRPAIARVIPICPTEKTPPAMKAGGATLVIDGSVIPIMKIPHGLVTVV